MKIRHHLRPQSSFLYPFTYYDDTFILRIEDDTLILEDVAYLEPTKVLHLYYFNALTCTTSAHEISVAFEVHFKPSTDSECIVAARLQIQGRILELGFEVPVPKGSCMERMIYSQMQSVIHLLNIIPRGTLPIVWEVSEAQWLRLILVRPEDPFLFISPPEINLHRLQLRQDFSDREWAGSIQSLHRS